MPYVTEIHLVIRDTGDRNALADLIGEANNLGIGILYITDTELSAEDEEKAIEMGLLPDEKGRYQRA